MRIATFNVNSIRARMPRLTEWLAECQPDLVAIQETKVDDDNFPHLELEGTGYRAWIHGQKTYNGVCFLSREPVEDVRFGFGETATMPSDCRIISGKFRGVQVINTYVPNGTRVGSDKFAYKLQWLEEFERYCHTLGTSNDRLVWLGDINIAPTPDDVYESEKHLGGVGHHPDEFDRLEKIVDWGWHDCFRKFNHEPGHYTFWEFRMTWAFRANLGWRIDHIYASSALIDQVERCWVDRDVRGREKASDHAPVIAEINF